MERCKVRLITESPESGVRSAKERSRVRSPESAGFIRRTIHMEVVRSPESAGPKKGPGDLSVGPSI